MLKTDFFMCVIKFFFQNICKYPKKSNFAADYYKFINYYLIKREIMFKRIALFVGGAILSCGVAFAQTSVTGKVVASEDGEPVIGASIKVAGTNTGTVTDVDGNFSLNVPAGSKLEITYIGMNPQTVKASSNMKIVLTSDNKTLDEVVVVAYGTTTKASFTGSAAVMKDKDMSAAKSSLIKSLEGKMAGVNIGASTGDPGADQKVLIRGIGSISGSTQPLYVIDGVPVSNSDMQSSGLRSQSILSSINPNDIESMTVLKDAAASSLYGSRAANGVIIITTKKGKEGKTHVNYDMQIGWSNIAKKSALETMNSAEMKQYWKNALQGYFVYNEGMDEATAAAAAAEEFLAGSITTILMRQLIGTKRFIVLVLLPTIRYLSMVVTTVLSSSPVLATTRWRVP